MWSNPSRSKLQRQDHETSFIREVVVVFGFSWLAQKVMTKRKEQGIKLIVVKVEIVGIWLQQILSRTDLDIIILSGLQPNRPSLNMDRDCI
jgi:hypothetical protein